MHWPSATPVVRGHWHNSFSHPPHVPPTYAYQDSKTGCYFNQNYYYHNEPCQHPLPDKQPKPYQPTTTKKTQATISNLNNCQPMVGLILKDLMMMDKNCSSLKPELGLYVRLLNSSCSMYYRWRQNIDFPRLQKTKKWLEKNNHWFQKYNLIDCKKWSHWLQKSPQSPLCPAP